MLLRPLSTISTWPLPGFQHSALDPEEGIDQEVGSEGNGPSEMPPLEDSDEEDQQEVPRRYQRSTKGVPPARLSIDDYSYWSNSCSTSCNY